MSRTFAVGVIFAVACLAYVLAPLLGRGRVTAAWKRTPRRVVTDDEIEAAIRSYRATPGGGGACPVCGPRPESDAVFCSTCGRRLDGTANAP